LQNVYWVPYKVWVYDELIPLVTSYVPIIFPNIPSVFFPSRKKDHDAINFDIFVHNISEVWSNISLCHSNRTLFWLGVPVTFICFYQTGFGFNRPGQNSREHYIIYSTIYFYNVFYSKYLWQQAKHCYAWPFCAKLSLSESTIHWLQCAKIFGFWAKLKIVWHFSTKKHNTLCISY